jgi:hypothetical protein
MKSHTHSAAWIHEAGAGDIAATGAHTGAQSQAHPARIHGLSRGCRSESGTGLAGSMRVVGVLAFCQAIVFLVLFLVLCARVGAATESKSGHGLELVPSTYSPQNSRDPFGAQVVGGADTNGTATVRPVDAGTLKLMGILYDAAHPSALVNDQLLELNRPVKMQTAQGEMEVRALKITRDLVVLQVGGQTMELRLGGAAQDPNAR